MEFKNASEEVEDIEALRVLKLLEAHHKKASELIRSRDEAASAASSARGENGGSSATSLAQPTFGTLGKVIEKSNSKEAAVVSSRSQSPVTQRRYARELSSSIASNLATARGIPGAPSRRGQVVPSQGGSSPTTDRLATAKSPSRNSEEKPSNDPRTIRSSTRQEKTVRDIGDEAFRKFYSKFEGLVSTLSAPLAFAGLPLEQDEHDNAKKTVPTTHSTAAWKSNDGRPSVSHEMEMSRLFSAASLRAARDNHANMPTGMHESFYVVPPAGGTMSYASMLSRGDKPAGQMSTSAASPPDQDTEHFVDAYDTPQPTSPSSARSDRAGVSTRRTTKTVEELEIENASLKQNMDNLSRRLYMWERSSQSQTSAIQQSIRTLKTVPVQVLPSSSDPQAHTATKHEDARMRELEDKAQAARLEMEKYVRENEKLKTVVMRYRERWEKLKEGARVRREGTGRIDGELG